MRALPNFRSVSWAKDYWPDALWHCSILVTYGQLPGLNLCAKTLDVIDDVVRPHLAHLEERDRPIIDGRLTTFDRVPEGARTAIIDELEKRGIYKRAFPEDLAHVLGLYPTAPGRWLLNQWLDRGLSVDWEKAQRFLAPVREASADGQSQVATDAKAIVLRQFLKAGRLTLPEKLPKGFELLPLYPHRLSQEELRIVRPTIRATYGALVGLEQYEAGEGGAIAWAMQFWRSNWRLFPCQTAHELEPRDVDNNSSIGEIANEVSNHLRTLRDKFLTAARHADPDLYAPDKYEVLTGIGLRSLRLVAAAVNTPILWSGEFGMPIVRSVVESLLIVRWLVRRDNPDLYVKFKDFGRGRLKLLKLHVEEYVDSLGDQAPQGLLDYAEYLDVEVNQDIGEEYQDIDLSSTFSGVSARSMAEEVGMEREYRLIYGPASGVAHGEWPALDRYALEQCTNPLHGGHRVPRSADFTLIQSGVVDLLVSLVSDVVGEYVAAFEASAFPAPPC